MLAASYSGALADETLSDRRQSLADASVAKGRLRCRSDLTLLGAGDESSSDSLSEVVSESESSL